MHAQPRRRLFQFSLTGMFVVVTIITVTLGWELRFIRERRALFELMIERGANATRDSELVAIYSKQGVMYKPNVLPWWRRLLGDEAVECIVLSADSLDLSDEAARLYPESEIWDGTIPLSPRAIQYPNRDRGEVK